MSTVVKLNDKGKLENASKVKSFPVRIPNDLLKWIKHRAVDSEHSVNTEIVLLLESVRKPKGG